MKNSNKVDSPSTKKVEQTSVNAPATKGTLKANLQKKEFLNNLKGEKGAINPGKPTTPAPSEPEVPKAPTPTTPDEFNPPQDPTPVKDSPSSMAKRTPGPTSPSLPEKNRTGEDMGSMDSNSKPRVSDQNRGDLDTNSKPMGSPNRYGK